MPHALIYINAEVTEAVQQEIAQEAMKILADVIGKPIAYCAAQVVKSIGGFAGKCCPSAFVDIKSIGGLKNKQEGLSDRFCTMLKNKAGIEGAHVYLNFTEMTGSNWGWNNGTF